MWSKISNALKPREGNDVDPDHLDTQSIAHHPPPDPFCANATTYYTQQTPPTPPPCTHSRTASREEDIIWSLRTQLALQRELCAQFEIDLGARDELVETLTIRLDAAEKENAKRKSVVRSWKKKAADLETMCRQLEEEVDNSRQESMERCIMDTASGEALRQLHQQISQLERQKNEVEVERNSLVRTVENMEAEVTRLKKQLGTTEASEVVRQLHDQISQLDREKSDVEGERSELARAVDKAEAEISQLEQEKNDIEAERNSLARTIENTEAEKSDVERERNDFSSEVSRLRVHIQQLQKDSAAMEVTIVQLNKQLEQDKEDIAGLNIALESKQQELELVKRKHGARGTAGSTAGRTSAAPSTVGNPSALGRVMNTKPPATAVLRRASASKENAPTPIPLKNTRRIMVLA